LEEALKLKKRGPKFKKDKIDAKDKMITEQKIKASLASYGLDTHPVLLLPWLCSACLTQ